MISLPNKPGEWRTLSCFLNNLIMPQTRQWSFWHLLFWEVFISVEMKNPLASGQAQASRGRTPALPVPTGGAHQPQACCICWFAFRDPSMRFLQELLLPRASTGTRQSSQSSASFACLLLLSAGLHSGRRNKRRFLFVHPVLHPSPSLVRREIRIPGKSCSPPLQHCGAVLRPALLLILAHICYVRASNSLSQIFQMQMFRQWTMGHIIWKHFFFSWTFVMDAVQNVKIEIAYSFFSRCFVVHRSIFI